MEKKTINLVKMLFGIVIFFCSSGLFLAEEYYISPVGNDGFPGTLTQPWKTISKANETLQPGDTVYIRSGTYNETIAPKHSGSEGSPITYKRYQEEFVTITGVEFGVDLREKHYIVIDGIQIINPDYCWVNMQYCVSTHNEIKNCYMDEVGIGWAGIFMGGDPSNPGKADYNKFINNIFIGKCHPENLVQCSYGANYNLFEGNVFHFGPHASIEFTGMGTSVTHNIVRKNTIRNPWHTGINFYCNADENLIEDNIIFDCGEDYLNNVCGSERDRTNPRHIHSGIQIGASRNIIRRNVLINNGAFMIESYDLVCYKGVYSLDNRIYHNTFYQNHWGLVGSPDMPQLDRNVIKNNIFYLNETFEIRWRTQNAVDGNYFGGNSILGGDIEWYPAGYQSLSYLQNNYPEFWFGNISENPMFTDEHSHDLTLKPGSPMIERGLFLTKTTDAGSGVSIPVKDARYFMDGWGIIEGDIIQLERNPQTARIIAVDYEENTLTVDVSLSWEAGQGVSLDFKGYSPDIGAFEFDPEKKKRKAQR